MPGKFCRFQNRSVPTLPIAARTAAGEDSPRRTWDAGSIALVLLLVFLCPNAAPADVIYIRGEAGETIDGVIDDDRSDENRVFIRTKMGLLPVARNRIERIERRANVTQEERDGDLAFQRGDYVLSLKLYLKAESGTEDDEILGRKIKDARERIEQEKQRRYAEDFRKVDELIRKREFATAIERVLTLVKDAPDESSSEFLQDKLSETYLAQAREYTNLVNYNEAEKMYRKAIESSSLSAAPQLELAELIAQSPARRDEAFALYREGLTYASEDPTLVEPKALLKHRYNEAQLYYRESLYREAAELFWAVHMADEDGTYPNIDEIIVRALSSIRSKLSEATEENARATRILEGVVEYKPTRADAQYLLGRIYCDREQWEDVVPAMETALQGLVGPDAASDRAEARQCLAMAYRATGELQQAAVQLETLVASQPSRYEARCELGEVYLAQLENQRALDQFNEAIALDDGSYRAYLGTARTLRQLSRYTEARENYEKLIDLRKDHPAYIYELGLTYADLNEHTEARDQFKKAVDLIKADEAPVSEEYRAILGNAYTQLGLTSVAERNYYEAIQNFDLALENHPDLPAAYDGKGQAFRELGKLKEAESFFKKALSLDPDNPKFLLNLGVFFHKLKKNRQRALPFYMRYFEAGGTDPQVRDWIRECGGTPPAVS